MSEATVAEKKKKAAQRKPRFQHKVLVSILVPVVVFCIVTNLTIGALFGHELMMKKVDTERGYLSVIYSYLEDAKNNLDTLALYAEGSLAVRGALKNSSLESVRAKRYALDAQEKLATALSASPVERYVDNMFLINRAGVKIVVTSGTGVVLTDQILESPLFEKAEKGRNAVAEITESVVDKGERKLSYLYPLDMEQNSFLYIEVSDRMITDLLAPYADAAEIVRTFRPARSGGTPRSEGKRRNPQGSRKENQACRRRGFPYHCKNGFRRFRRGAGKYCKRSGAAGSAQRAQGSEPVGSGGEYRGRYRRIPEKEYGALGSREESGIVP